VNNIHIVKKKLKEEPVRDFRHYVFAILAVLKQLEMYMNCHKDIVKEGTINDTNAYAYISSIFLQTVNVVNKFAYIPNMLNDQESASVH
jgi:hypothetical protein